MLRRNQTANHYYVPGCLYLLTLPGCVQTRKKALLANPNLAHCIRSPGCNRKQPLPAQPNRPTKSHSGSFLASYLPGLLGV